MKELYLKLIELRSEIPEIKYIDLNFGQLQEEKPSISYPAVLINISGKAEDVNSLFQIYTGSIDLTLVCKMLSETNSNAPEVVRLRSLQYLDLSEKIWQKLQGYADSYFDSFTRKSVADQNIRRGVKTNVQRYETSWRQIKESETIFPLNRYMQYFGLEEFTESGNVFYPPANYYNKNKMPENVTITNFIKTEYLGLLTEQIFYSLPYIDDKQRNPHLYNATYNYFSCIYVHSYGNNFLKHSVNKASKAGAGQCIAVFERSVDANKNLYALQQRYILGDLDKINSIVIIIGSDVRSYTRQEIIDLYK